MRTLSNRQRLGVFLTGFALGCVLVSLLLRYRQHQQQAAAGPADQPRSIVPGIVAQWMAAGQPIDATFILSQTNTPAANGVPAMRRVVIPGLDPGTFVLVEQPGGLISPAKEWKFMQADRVRAQLAPGADTKAMAEALAPLGWKFLGREPDGWTTIALGAHQADTVPKALEQLRAWPQWVSAAEPQFLPLPPPPGARGP